MHFLAGGGTEKERERERGGRETERERKEKERLLRSERQLLVRHRTKNSEK